jgi:hypothetical protein
VVILAGKFALMRFTLLPRHTFRLPDRLRDPSPQYQARFLSSNPFASLPNLSSYLRRSAKPEIKELTVAMSRPKMNVIGHQAVGVDDHSQALSISSEPF